MRWWNVSQAVRGPKGGKMQAVPLGDVYARNYGHALGLAWERWPDKLDDTQVQRGISLRLCNCEDCVRMTE